MNVATSLRSDFKEICNVFGQIVRKRAEYGIFYEILSDGSRAVGLGTAIHQVDLRTDRRMDRYDGSEICFFLWRCDPTRVMASSFLRFLDHTQRRTTVGRTPLDE